MSLWRGQTSRLERHPIIFIRDEPLISRLLTFASVGNRLFFGCFYHFRTLTQNPVVASYNFMRLAKSNFFRAGQSLRSFYCFHSRRNFFEISESDRCEWGLQEPAQQHPLQCQTLPNSARGDRQSAPWGVHLGVHWGGDFGVHQMLCTVLFCTLMVCTLMVCKVFSTMVVCTVCIITVLPPCTTVGAQTDRGIAAAASSGNGSKSRCRLSKADHIVSVSRINLTLGQWSKVAWGAGVVFTCQCISLVVIVANTDCASVC